MASIYQRTGKYLKSEQNINKILSYYQKDTTQNALIYNIKAKIILAEIKSELGDFENASKIYLNAISQSKKLGEKNELELALKHNLGLLYCKSFRSIEGEKILKECKVEFEKLISISNPIYLTLLHNLALAYSINGKYSDAVDLYKQSLEGTEKVFGKNNLDYAYTLGNLGEVFILDRKYELGLPLLEEAKTIIANSVGKDSKQYNEISKFILVCYYGLQKYDKAIELSQEIQINSMNLLGLNFNFLTESEKINFINYQEYTFDLLHSVCSNKIGNAVFGTELYNYALFMKGIVLESEQLLSNSIKKSNNIEILLLYNQINNLKKYLSVSNLNLLQEDSLKNKIYEVEKVLLEKVNKNPEILKNALLQIKWKEVQNSLHQGDAAIEFIKFRKWNYQWTDSIYYYAVLITKESTKPEKIFLFEERVLKKIINTTSYDGISSINKLYETRGAYSLNEGESSSENNDLNLYNLIWKPLEKNLSGVKRIYFSNIGLLNNISFSAIRNSENNLISDRFELNQLSSTRELVDKNSETKANNFYLFGGIDYNADSTLLKRANQTYQSISKLIVSRNFTRDTTFSYYQLTYLKGTMTEVEGIQGLLYKHNISSSLFTGHNASEESFKTLNGKSPRVIHIATHGFFYPDLNEKPQENKLIRLGEDQFRYSSNPLLRSGLMFAGANHAWNGEPVNQNLEDGILTAYEISQMDLYGTELVVLSACETGLGDINGSEGVFGLQRAFKMAGVKTLIMSLWKVPDSQTSLLMNTFYENWMKGQTKHQAFVNAQKAVRIKYSNPYYWAGFVMVD